ncbi:phosphate transporter PHO1-like [Selaginella moellendorffii]|uniref:phosphate transporter PHO1-like n=1 Tax=Selaginella moellendorffii TaxID=88036 RepID=UPI000D1CB882|nr:phosphate transporter PHO1-like [Selaginella moellendorffii]|eukprot:XP_024533310.1 phosphate transporter PHO1-like [Selaginella moellendorffii]
MVKFSKQLDGQLVPEWRSAYCDYWQLKKDLKQVKLVLRKKQILSPGGGGAAASADAAGSSPSPADSSPLRTFSGLTRRKILTWSQSEVIRVHQLPPDELYETELLGPISQVEEEKMFFARLDGQLNNVNKFYRRKEEEYCKRAEALSRQMSLLIETKQTLELFSGDNSAGNSSIEMGNSLERQPIFGPQDVKSPASPTTTIASLSQALIHQSKKNISQETDIHATKKKVHSAEKVLRLAFIEFYRGLGLLKSFSSLNVVAFAKILKKYDKVTGRKAMPTYLRAVESSFFSSSDKAANLMEKVEKLFTEHFAKNDRKHAMTCLRPMQQKASHTVTFFLGVFTGGFVALLAAFLIVSHITGSYISAAETMSESSYMESIFPTFSMLALVLLHMYMYGCNVYAWRRERINYPFIFEFQPGKELRHREIFLLSTGLTTVVVGGMVAHLVAHVKAKASTSVDLIPAAIVLIFLGLLFFPFDLFYRSSRAFFTRCLRHIVFAPFYKVVLADFFLADQLTSQVTLFRHLEFVICYYGWGHFKTKNTGACVGSSKDIMYFVSLIPYWWRLLQCLRRWIDERNRAHIANGGKYLSAMVAVGSRLSYIKKGTTTWLVMFIITSTIATLYQLYWDLVIDWGLLQPCSINAWLRDRLILKHKSFYFVSMVLNTLLRFAWLQSITNFQFTGLDRHVTEFIFASLEVFRRGQWNFYRIENEHLNNVGNFRAVKCVPLPFRETQDIEV